MKIDIEDIKTISIAEDEHLFINIKDNEINHNYLNSFRKHLARVLGHNRIIVINVNDIEMTKIKYVDAIMKNGITWGT